MPVWSADESCTFRSASQPYVWIYAMDAPKAHNAVTGKLPCLELPKRGSG